MNELTIGLLSALLATNPPQAVSNVVQQQTGISLPLTDVNDPVEKELRELMIADDAATAEVDQWIKSNDVLVAEGKGEPAADLNKHIRARFDIVRKGYEDFLARHPNNAHGYMAYGSFLNDIGDEDAAVVQYENAKQIDPKNPAVWNNLANYYGENGPVTNAFAYYAEAIRLNPAEPVYYQNFATTVYLFRKDAREFYHINEQQVFDKALTLYKQAMKLAPQDFVLATDYAESYYGIKPLRTNDALVAWTNALHVARTDAEREGVQLHFARVKIAAGFFDQAQAHLDSVTNVIYAELKHRLERSLADHENPPTNSIPTTPPNSVTNSANIQMAGTNLVLAVTNDISELTNIPPASPKTSVLSTNLQSTAPLQLKQP